MEKENQDLVGRMYALATVLGVREIKVDGEQIYVNSENISLSNDQIKSVIADLNSMPRSRELADGVTFGIIKYLEDKKQFPITLELGNKTYNISHIDDNNRTFVVMGLDNYPLDQRVKLWNGYKEAMKYNHS